METPGSQLLKISAHSLRPTAFWKPWIVCPSLRCNVIEAPWLVNGGHGASLRHHTCGRCVPPCHLRQTDRGRALSGKGRRDSPLLRVRVRVEIMESQKCRNVGKSQRVLIMANPIISSRTRSTKRPQTGLIISCMSWLRSIGTLIR
jgi:hypothetical protein